MAQDWFESVDDLLEHLAKSQLRVVSRDRDSWMTVIAPHGGFIEFGTSALAQAIAACNYNLFDFQALHDDRFREYHVTSTKFRRPKLSAMMAKSDAAITLHGMVAQEPQTIWLGGLNKRLKRIMLAKLLESGFLVNANPPGFRGEDPENIVNLAAKGGVQVELPDDLRKTLFDGPAYDPSGDFPGITLQFAKLVTAVRASIRKYRNA